ncbi:MAG: gamma carbonic anhydrase family protein [Candidatus Diapherotrites archaeon]
MLKEFKNKKPKIHASAFVAENASVIGNVEISENSSIWFGAVVRGDLNSIKIGARTNVQDNAVLHVSEQNSLEIGDDVTIGHSAIVHGCKIGNNCLIGMGAVILSGAVIGDNCVVGAGSVVTENYEVPSGSVVLGVPGKVKRKISEVMLDDIKRNVSEYVELKEKYK